MLELQVVIATLVGRFSFSLPPGEAPGVDGLTRRITYAVTMHPRGGMPLIAAPRAPLAPAARA
jgi:hypothetical protein